MAYEPYVTPEYYQSEYGGNIVPADDFEKGTPAGKPPRCSLTYNSIVGRGFARLTGWQQEVIREVVCQQADFETENEDEISTVLQSYSINGVSAQFGSSWNVFTDKAVAMKRDVYALLCQTGLCCRLAR